MDGDLSFSDAEHHHFQHVQDSSYTRWYNISDNMVGTQQEQADQ